MSRLPGHVRATLYGTFTCGCGCYYFITSASKKGRPSCGGVHGLDLSDRRSWSTPGAVKRKFHYADFATKSRTCRGRKSWKSATQITSPTFMICVADFRDLCPRLCRRLSSSIVTGQIPLERHKRVCHGLCRKHIDMSRWFVSATFVLCLRDFHRNFITSWFVTVCVRDFPCGEVSVKFGVMEFEL